MEGNDKIIYFLAYLKQCVEFVYIEVVYHCKNHALHFKRMYVLYILTF